MRKRKDNHLVGPLSPGAQTLCLQDSLSHTGTLNTTGVLSGSGGSHGTGQTYALLLQG